MPADRRVAVAERLERGDLRALQRQRPGQRHVEDERGDQQEDQRQQEAEALELRELVLHRPVRQLQGPRDGPKPAVRLQYPIDVGDHLVNPGVGRQSEHHVVEAAFHVERGGQRQFVDPEDAEAFVVRHQFARPDAVDVLGRERHANDGQVAQTAIDHRRYPVARFEPVGNHEPLAGQHFVGSAGLDPAAAPQEQIVEPRPPIRRDRDQPAAGRLVDLRQIQRHAGNDSGFERRDARDGADLAGHSLRRPLERGEDVGEALALVVGALGRPQGLEVRQVHDVHGDAGGHDHCNRHRLAAHRQQVAQQLAVERGQPQRRAHRVTTSAGPAPVFRSGLRSRRSARRRGG
jgi:hypothetical protein